METRYPIRAVAKITGLGLDTLRAWERRYQAVTPEHTSRGRQYGPAQIERLLLLSRLVQKGHAIGQIAGLPDLELQNILDRPIANPAMPQPAAPGDMLAPVLAAVEQFDSARAADELSRLAAILAPRDLVYEVALPLMQETGRRWHNGAFAIAQEHLVSQILRNLLGGMMRLFRHAGSAPKLILATTAGESHDFGILAAAMLAGIAGLDPVYLGASLPATEIVNAAERTGAEVVAVSATYPDVATSEEVSAIAAALPERVEFWLGGEGSTRLDLSGITRNIILIRDFPAFEKECLRWRKYR